MNNNDVSFFDYKREERTLLAWKIILIIEFLLIALFRLSTLLFLVSQGNGMFNQFFATPIGQVLNNFYQTISYKTMVFAVIFQFFDLYTALRLSFFYKFIKGAVQKDKGERNKFLALWAASILLGLALYAGLQYISLLK